MDKLVSGIYEDNVIGKLPDERYARWSRNRRICAFLQGLRELTDMKNLHGDCEQADSAN